MYEEEFRARERAKDLSPDTALDEKYQRRILDLCGFEY
jgi:hypothetical protein